MALFNKNRSNEARSARRNAAAPPLRDAGNTPPAVYGEGSALDGFAEIYGSSLVQARRWFLVALAALALAAVGGVAVVTLLPLKEVRPWVVEINTSTGVVNKPVEVVRIDPNLQIVKSELARWAEAVYAIDPLRSRDLLRWANARAADAAVGQFAAFRAGERIYERIANEPGLVREAKVTAVEASQRGTAFVYLSTQERVGTANPGPDKVRRYRLTLNYRLTLATQEADLLANPLGLYVTYFAAAEERAP